MTRSNPTLLRPQLNDLLQMFMDNRLESVNVALPGKIEAYLPSDQATQSADIQPLVSLRKQNSDGTESVIKPPVIPSVPIVFPRAGDFFISLPLKVGDHVLLIFNQRSIELFTGSAGNDVVDPVDGRMHHIADAVAIPGFYPFGKSLVSPNQKSIIIGHDKGCQVHVNKDEIALGSEAPEHFVALAGLVKENLDEIKAKFDKHAHTAQGPTSLTTGPETAAVIGTHKIDVTDTASKKVKSD